MLFHIFRRIILFLTDLFFLRLYFSSASLFFNPRFSKFHPYFYCVFFIILSAMPIKPGLLCYCPFLRRKSLTFLKDGSSDSRHCISFPYLFHQPKEYRVLKQQRKSCPFEDSFSLPFHMAAAIPKYFKHDSD